MIKLYYSAGSCSTACHMSLEYSGLKYEAIEIDWEKENDPNIALVTKLNPLGTLPVLVTDDGKVLYQNVAIHTYIADLAPRSKLLPEVGTFERAEAMNWLSFVNSDLHKGIGGLFSVKAVSPDLAVQEAYKKYCLSTSHQYLKFMNAELEGRNFLTGKEFCAADAYAYVVTGWCEWLEIPLESYTNIIAYRKRVASHPVINKVLKAEGLI